MKAGPARLQSAEAQSTGRRRRLSLYTSRRARRKARLAARRRPLHLKRLAPELLLAELEDCRLLVASPAARSPLRLQVRQQQKRLTERIFAEHRRPWTNPPPRNRM